MRWRYLAPKIESLSNWTPNKFSIKRTLVMTLQASISGKTKKPVTDTGKTHSKELRKYEKYTSMPPGAKLATITFLI